MEIISIKKELDAKVLLEHCIENFDFLKVRLVMVFLDWKWAHVGATPNTTQMKNWVKDLSESLLKNMKENPKQRKFSTSSGGFEIIFTRTYEGCEPDNMEIKFVLESWDQQVLETPFE
jgi:hypothetical protein